MHSNKLTSLVLCLSILVVTCLFAFTGASALAEERLYTNFKLLDMQFDSDSPNPPGAFDIDNGLRFEMGYRFNDNLAFEIGINKFDDAYEAGSSADGLSWKTKTGVDGYTFGLKGFLPIGTRAEFWGSAGVFLWDVEWDGTFINYPGYPNQERSGRATDDGRDFYASLGIDFLLTEEFYVTFEYAQYAQSDVFESVNRDNASDLEQNYVGIGIGATF